MLCYFVVFVKFFFFLNLTIQVAHQIQRTNKTIPRIGLTTIQAIAIVVSPRAKVKTKDINDVHAPTIFDKKGSIFVNVDKNANIMEKP